MINLIHKNMLNTFLKGILLGITNMIPGISAGTLALMLGIYYKIINSLSNLVKFKEIKKNLIFLTNLLAGILTSITIITKILKIYVFNNKITEALLMIFFIGIISSSIFTLKKEIPKKEKINIEKLLKCLPMFICISIIILFIIFKILDIYLQNEIKDKDSTKYYIMIMTSGIISGSAMILPGISGSAMILMMGFYKEIVSILDELKLKLLTIFALSSMIGIIVTTLTIQKILKKHFKIFIYSAMGLILGSIIQMIFTLIKLNLTINLTNFILLNIALALGIYTSKTFEKCKSKY